MLFRPAVLFAICVALVLPSDLAAQDRPFARPALKPLTLKPVSPNRASQQRTIAKSHAVAKRSDSDSLVDVELTSNRSLVGSMVDAQGKPVAGVTVTAKYGRRVLAETKTDRQGEFRFRNIRTGVFEIRSRLVRRVVRVWSNGTAPKNARREALLVADPGTRVRAQSPVPFTPTAVSNGLVEAGLLIGATVGVGAIAVNQTDDTIPAPVSQSQVQAAMGGGGAAFQSVLARESTSSEDIPFGQDIMIPIDMDADTTN